MSQRVYVNHLSIVNQAYRLAYAIHEKNGKYQRQGEISHQIVSISHQEEAWPSVIKGKSVIKSVSISHQGDATRQKGRQSTINDTKGTFFRSQPDAHRSRFQIVVCTP